MDGASVVTRGDSAGVITVRLDLSVPLDAVPLDTIARVGLDPDGALYRVSGAAVLGDSLLVVGDGGGAVLRRYARDGRWVADMGGPGEGPGEFSNFISVHPAPGDSIAVGDFLQRRVTFFSRDGRPGRIASTVDLGPNVNVVCIRPDGRIVVTETHLKSLQPDAVNQDSLAVIELDGTGRSRLLASHASRKIYFHQAEGRPPAIDDLPFSSPGTVSCAHGSLLADGGLLMISPVAQTVRIVGPDGDDRVRIVRSDPAPAIAPDALRTWRERMDTSTMFSEWAEHVPVPDRYAPISAARALPGDRIVLDWRDADGRLRRGLLELGSDRLRALPANGEVIGASARALVVLERDAYDVESVLWLRY